MGWWYVEGTKALVGDQPLETLRDALSDISCQYEKALKRRPSKAEWEALIAAVLGAAEAAGFQAGDLIVKADNKRIRSFQDLQQYTTLRANVPITLIQNWRPGQTSSTSR